MCKDSSIGARIAVDGLKSVVGKLATRFQFELAGVAAMESAPELEYFREWIDAGRAGEMEWLARRNADGELKRSRLQAALPWARSVIMVAASYHSEAPLSTEEAPAGSGWIARYAQPGSRDGAAADYHEVLLENLRGMEAALHAELAVTTGEFQSRSYVDTGPLVERVYAQYAGLGWVGKNTCLIHPEAGSWLFLAGIVTSLEVVGYRAETTLLADRCGTCTRCIDACPTSALVAGEPYTMDASRCIAYLTIEKRGSIPLELRQGIGRNVFGCDICQDVCPWNARARRRGNAAGMLFGSTRPELVNPDLGWLGSLGPEEFRRLFRGTPLERTKWRGLMRNVAIAMGNSREARHRQQLTQWAALAQEPELAEAAQWALQQLEQAGGGEPLPIGGSGFGDVGGT